MDQGVGADFVGNLFWLLLDRFPGPKWKDRIKALHADIQRWYAAKGVENKLQTLTAGMIKKRGAPPKLRAKAAELRALIPYAKDAATRLLRDASPVEKSVKQMACHLATLYDTLSSQTIFRQDLMSTHCRKFCLLYTGLEQKFRHHKMKLWRIKPKFHLMQEMCEMTDGADPSLSWTYRDEDFGGSVATMTRRKGGVKTVLGTSRGFLARFAARHDVPAIL